jgi:hypothetical protein
MAEKTEKPKIEIPESMDPEAPVLVAEPAAEAGEPKPGTIEQHGSELCAVRGFELDGKALCDDPRNPKGRAWLYNAARARFGWPAGLVLERSKFEACLAEAADVPMVSASGRHSVAQNAKREERAGHVRGKKRGDRTPVGKVS